jgi:hypothetical protein
MAILQMFGPGSTWASAKASEEVLGADPGLFSNKAIFGNWQNTAEARKRQLGKHPKQMRR